jgi:hypothetical protein
MRALNSFFTFFRSGSIVLLLCAVQLMAQSTNTPPSVKPEKNEKSSKKPSAHAFHGKLAALDRRAKSISVGKSTYWITSDTVIKSGSLETAIVGEPVSGYVKPAEDGRLVASSLKFGAVSGSKTGATSTQTTAPRSKAGAKAPAASAENATASHSKSGTP